MAFVATATHTASGSATVHRDPLRFSRCPGKSKGEGRWVRVNRNPKAVYATVPSEPSAVQLCRYNGLNAGGRSLTLARERVLTKASSVRSIVGEFVALEMESMVGQGGNVGPGTTYAMGCPMADGSVLYATFAYTSHRDAKVRVEVTLSGGPKAWNGRTPHSYPLSRSPSLLGRLKALTGSVK